MIGIDEALAKVLEQAARLSPSPTPLDGALGLVLAEDVASDIDSPPHDKSVVDGYAVLTATLAAGVELQVIEEVTAGEVPRQRVAAGNAIRIMTGAPIPHGADAVVMVERVERIAASAPASEERIRLTEVPRAGQNIMRQGLSMRRGQQVLSTPRVLGPTEIGLLAEVGRASVQVIPLPSVAIVPTGNELVEPSATPGPGQIRNSNGPLLSALTRDAQGAPRSLGVARDTVDDLRRLVLQGLACDVLLLSGGVSEGVLDLAPQVLSQCGVEQVFHKVNLKPGKPLWFGVKRHDDGRRTLVFGLPGNPVSTLVCFQLFVRPALAALAGRRGVGLPTRRVGLAAAHQQRGDRPTYWPVAWRQSAAGLAMQPLAWQGSGDLRTLADADGLAFFAGGDRRFDVGEEVDVSYWREPMVDA